MDWKLQTEKEISVSRSDVIQQFNVEDFIVGPDCVVFLYDFKSWTFYVLGGLSCAPS